VPGAVGAVGGFLNHTAPFLVLAAWRSLGFEEAAQVGLVDRRLAGGDVVEPAVVEPALQAVDLLEEMVETIDHEARPGSGRLVCIGTWPATSWKTSGSGRMAR